MNARLESAILYSLEQYREGSSVTRDEHLMAKEILRLRAKISALTTSENQSIPPSHNPERVAVNEQEIDPSDDFKFAVCDPSISPGITE